MSATSHSWLLYRTLVMLVIGGTLYGCGSAPPRVSGSPVPPYTASKDGAPVNPPDIMGVPDAVPRVEPRSRYGNPGYYVVMGKQYQTLPHEKEVQLYSLPL